VGRCGGAPSSLGQHVRRRTRGGSPALLAPLALLFPWAAVVGHLGTELGGPEFFHQWLTKHPDLGPVNCEVLLGILCLLGASLAPTVLAIYRLMGGHRRVVVLLLSAATVLAYLPVLIRLDLLLWVIGLLDARPSSRPRAGRWFGALRHWPPWSSPFERHESANRRHPGRRRARVSSLCATPTKRVKSENR